MFRSHVSANRPTVFADKHYSNTGSVRSLRKLVEILDQRHSSVSIGGLLAHTVMEALSVAVYVWTSQESRATSVKAFQWSLPAFIVEVVLNIIFFLEWVALFFFEQDKKAYMVSWLSVVNAMTSVPMIVIGCGALSDSSWRNGWVPMYLRVWWLRDCLCVLLDYPQIARLTVDIYREMARFFVQLFAVMCTCIGTHQIVESCCGRYMDVYDSTYMMVVAFGTIGFGDVTPVTTPARIFMCGFLIIGISYFLPLFQKLSRIGEMKHFYASVGQGILTEKRRHVIICGQFSDLAVDILLRNFYAGWRKYLDTRVVLMSPEEFTPEVRLTVNLPWFKGRVTMLVGDPATVTDLQRADAHHADAIFLFGNARSSAHYNDYTIIGQAMAVGLFDPDLPQHLMLRRGRTVKQVAPYAASVLEMERTVHQLLGLSMAQPGVIPFIINLLRTYEALPADMTLSRHWVEQYEYSLRNDLYAIEVPDALRGREFRVLARAFFDRDVTLIGLLSARNIVQLNPQELLPNAKKLILIAKTMKMARDATMEISRNYEQTFGEEMLVAPDPDEHDRRAREALGKVRRAKSFVETSSTSSSSTTTTTGSFPEENDNVRVFHDEDTGEENTSESRSGAYMMRTSLMQVDDAYDSESHFIVIDLSSAKCKDRESRYAQEAALSAVAHDIFHVMAPIRQAFPMNDIVLLTNDISFAPYFDHYWNPSDDIASNPVKYILGCGLNTADLRRCNFAQCAGSCIFYSGDISRYGSTSAMSMLVVLSINDIVQGTPTFPVVVELEGLANLPLFPPYAEDQRLRSKADLDFVFEPNFLIGNAISRLMLYPALQRTYFMEEFIDVMDVLISGHAPGVPALSRLALRMCETELETYQDVMNYCLQHGLLPVALHRRIHDLRNPSINGQRFVLTNPPRGLPVYQETDLIFYITPG